MIQNYLKIAFRNLRRRPFFSVVNISGLAVGLAACWLIGIFILHEKSFDRFLPEADRICAVALDLKMGDESARTTNTPPPLGIHLAAEFPEIELAARSFALQSVVARFEQAGQTPRVFNETMAFAVDTSFLELFNFPMAKGNAFSALDRPGSLVLTEKTAEKYFGNKPAMGQTLAINDRNFTVTGIAKNLPANSTVQFDFLLPVADFRVVDRFSWSWIWLQMDTWVRLRQAASPENLAALEAKFPKMVQTHAPAAFERVGQNFEEQQKRGDKYEVKLLPLMSLHLRSEGLISRLVTLGDGGQVKIFGIVGGLILLLACFNFMNLSTALSMKRAREVGVRKALGSQRSALVGQFLMESLFFSLAGLAGAAILAGIAMPVFKLLTGLEMGFSELFSFEIMAILLGLTALTGLLGGLYPAFYLSKFKPTDIFKSTGGGSKKGQVRARGGLVVVQFSVSLVLMLFSWLVFRQLEFAKAQSPGLNRQHVLILENTKGLGEGSSQESFRQQLLQLPEVKNATQTTFLPSAGSFGDFYEPEQGNQTQAVVKNLPISSFLTDAYFVPTLGMELLTGRNFSENPIADSASVILNEAAVRAIGWQDAIGKWLRYPGNRNQRFQVVGVVKDFHLASVRSPIEPVAIFHQSSKTYSTWSSCLALRIQPGSEQSVIEKTEALWSASAPTAPFAFDFLDASFARLYRSETKMGLVLGLLTALAIFIGCLGLFALAAFAAEQRTKEIGIRKVLGASVSGITTLLAKDFLKLVLIAILIASPLAWYFMDKWLADFSYRIEISWWMFALAGLIAVAVAFLTIGFQSVKAALANPVESLRSE